MNRLALVSTLVALLVFTTSPAGQSQEDTHEAAVEEMLVALNMAQTLEDSIALMSNLAITATPQLAPYRATLEEFYAIVMSWEAVRPEFVALYKRTFSESEIRDITAFLDTPTGQKFAAEQTSLMQQGATIGEQAVLQNQGMLMDMLRRDGAPM